jgi:hypothetical protein
MSLGPAESKELKEFKENESFIWNLSPIQTD